MQSRSGTGPHTSLPSGKCCLRRHLPSCYSNLGRGIANKQEQAEEAFWAAAWAEPAVVSASMLDTRTGTMLSTRRAVRIRRRQGARCSG